RDVLPAHDARAVDQGIEPRMLRQHALGEGLNGACVDDVENVGAHALPARYRRIERVAAPPGHDHPVAEIVKALRQGASDARAAAGDQDRVSGIPHVHAPIAVTWCQTRPPLANTVWPLTQAPFALQRAAMTSAMSAGSPRRLCGVRWTKPPIC